MLAASNANRPKGDFTGGSGISLHPHRRPTPLQASQYMPLVVAYRNGAPVLLSDVATVSDSVEGICATPAMRDLDPSILMFIFRPAPEPTSSKRLTAFKLNWAEALQAQDSSQ